jgi:hypothetical protein
MLWNRGPDDELLDAAAKGDLDDDEGLAKQVARLSKDKRAVEAQRWFLREWLAYDFARDRSKAESFNDIFTDEIKEALVKEVDETLEKHLSAGKPIMDLYTLNRSAGDETVRAFYDTDANPDGKGQFELPEHRQSILGLGAFIAANSGTSTPSPTIRGKGVLERFLCSEIDAPPADVDPVLPEPDGDEMLTVRERTERYILDEEQICFGCHQYLDPLGFFFEDFDVIGRHRETELVQRNGKEEARPVSSKGWVVDFDNAKAEGISGLGELLAKHEQAQTCLIQNYLHWTLGREDKKRDEALAKHILKLNTDDSMSLALAAEALARSQTLRFVQADR